MDNINQLEKKLNIVATIVSVAVLGLVASMRKIPRLDFGIDFSFLPAIYSFTNLLAAGFLLASLNFIRQKKIAQHKRMNILALSMSFAFLLMYVLYHVTTPEMKRASSSRASHLESSSECGDDRSDVDDRSEERRVGKEC